MEIFPYPLVWMPLADEIAPFRKYCYGIVLNAGSGQRSIQLGEKDLNIDITEWNKPDIIADLHQIPLLDESVDTIVSIAVLEHTRYPWQIVEEFYRVLRPMGYGVIAVPFLQPQHDFPGDYIRFTENGLIEIFKYAGFEIIETSKAHHFGQTLAWLLWEYLQSNPPHKFTWFFWQTLIRQLSLGNLLKGDSTNTHNTHYIVVRKPGDISIRLHYMEALVHKDDQDWFFPLLACPITKQPLHLKENTLVSQDGKFIYGFQEKIPYLEASQNSVDSISVNSGQLTAQLEECEPRLLSQLTEELSKLRSHLKNTELELQSSQDTIATMQSSKFWRLREGWVKLQKTFGFARE
jgi:uncharacterized protein YbaR (Trm112 family)